MDKTNFLVGAGCLTVLCSYVVAMYLAISLISNLALGIFVGIMAINLINMILFIIRYFVFCRD